ncbi:MAG: Cysteine desulfurase, SufS-like protein [Burkholderiaceae bacterium]|nr:Cysteine desulfurase, SufS-like protein [Burkholderiaceae bacterium]
MSIQTLTSNPSLPDAGLPDVALLTQLANEFFSSLPGEAPVGAPQMQALSVAPAPVLQPASPPAGETVSIAKAAPAAERGIAQGVPEAYAAALPVAAPPAAPAPSTPYYFLGEGSAYQSAPIEPGVTDENRIIAQSFGLPGTSELASLLDSLPSERTEKASPAAPGGFYFLDAIAGNPEKRPAQAAGKNANATPVPGAFDVEAVRRDFPILTERVNGRPLIWFDNAATTQKPQVVIDRLAYFYAHENSNIHRAAHELAARATDAYEAARSKVARFLGAKSADEIVFVRGATEGINLIAQTFGKKYIGEGDEIIVSLLEHHANIVPWQQLAAETGAKIRVIPVDDSGQIRLDEYQKLLNRRTRLVAITQVSNALGTITPVQEIIALAHRAGARVLVDGAQAVSHLRVNVQALDADFYIFSGHKVFAPTGIGAVYGKAELLDLLPPWQGGGNMIADVTFDKTLYQPAPARFEAGTGNIADAVGLGAALDYLERIGFDQASRYEHELLGYATQQLLAVPGLRLIGTARDKASVLSFVLNGYRTEEVGAALNREGIAVRSGHHCAQPILRRFGVEATVRPSLAFYNTCGEVDALVASLKQLAAGRRSF